MARAKFKTPKENRIRSAVTPYMVIIAVVLCIYAISLIVPLAFGFTITFRDTADYARGILNLPDLSYWANTKADNANKLNYFLTGTNLTELQNLQFTYIEDIPFLGYEHLFGNYIDFFVVPGRFADKYSYIYGWNMDITKYVTVDPTFLDLLKNTLLYAGVSGILVTMSPCIMGYLCARFPGKFAGFIYTFVIVVMTFPIVGTGAALLTLMKRISLHDTFWGLWIRQLSFMNTYFLVFYAYFKSLPGTYSEAAEIDGASHFRIMWTIYMPFAIKMISTSFLIQFVAAYNAYGINLLHLKSRPTLAYAAWYIEQNQQFTWPVRFAACYILSLPMLIFFILFKNKVMGNMTVGGLKG
jgi:ABC-type glycerol-3-phosphate transport system permease component